MGSTALTTSPAQDREWKPSAEDAMDLQGILVSAYPNMLFAETLLVQFLSKDPAIAPNAKGWLADITPRITYATGKVNPSINIAITAAGLCAIKLDAEVFATFSVPFQQGMIFATRAKFLGDIEGQDPKMWRWTDAASDPRGIHAQLLLFAEDQNTLNQVVQFETSNLNKFGLSVAIGIFQHVVLDANGMRREHFGFADGISQPTLVDGEAIKVEQRTLHEIAAGEVVLGQINTYGIPAPGPFVDTKFRAANGLKDGIQKGTKNLGLNGTYLVTRQLKQDVAAFWQNMDSASKDLRNEAGKPAGPEWLAEKAIGRTRTGYMLQPGGNAHAAMVPVGQAPPNDMTFFDTDAGGYGCPMTSHVRRANPRDGLAPSKKDLSQIIQATNRHRIIRRGRIYGEPIRDRMIDDGMDRGLLFHCLNSEIDRQFEFVQHTWLLNPMFGGAYSQSDPLVGPKCPFSIPSLPVRQQPVLETYITAQGGGYFFVPSRRALQFFGAM
jgi:Dyp-type peroxidase family